MPKKLKIKGYNSFSRLGEMLNILRKHDVVSGLSPEKLRLLLDALGPTFVKLGQIMSMRSDILPADYCAELRKLRSAAVPMPNAEVEKLLEEEYGEHWSNFFSEISWVPQGSASIAQVHCAVLNDGTKVALKVQRPRIREKMARDIIIFKRALKIMRIVSKIGDVVDFNMMLDEMWAVAQQEMDFIVEARHLEQFREFNRHIDYISCPKVFSALSTSKILVMEFIEGIPVDEVGKLIENGYDMTELGNKLAGNYVKQILEDGFFHADPHPGNINILDGKIVWIDLGMMGTLSARDREMFKKVSMSIVNNDVYELAMAMLTIGDTHGNASHGDLCADLDVFLIRFGSANLAELEYSQMMSELLEVALRHRISMPPGITMLSRGIMTMEGVLTVCCPETNLMEILSNFYSETSKNKLDSEKEILTALNKFSGAARKSAEIPGHIADVLKMAIRGQAKLNLDYPDYEEPLRIVSELVNSLNRGIICAALFIGASLICLTDMQPQILGIPLLGFVGFVAALLNGAWHGVWWIRSSRRYRHRRNIKR